MYTHRFLRLLLSLSFTIEALLVVVRELMIGTQAFSQPLGSLILSSFLPHSVYDLGMSGFELESRLLFFLNFLWFTHCSH